MNTITIYVNNIKCSGCAENIKQALSPVSGVASVNVYIEAGKVEIGFEGVDRRTDYVQILEKLGYPEKENPSFMQDHTIRGL